MATNARSETRAANGDTAVKRFWRRQFARQPSPRQIVFDALVGCLAPVLCLVFDPVVFRGDLALLSEYQVLAYVGIGLGVSTLCLWLLLSERAGEASGFFAGVLLPGALIALLVGVMLLPLSLIGLVVGIGALGFTPFLVAFVFLRNGLRAGRQARRHSGNAALLGSMFLGALLVMGVPATIHWRVSQITSHSIQAIIHGDAETAQDATRRLRGMLWCSAACFDGIVWAYEQEKDPTRREILAESYEQLTGRDIQKRLWVLID